MFGQSLIKKNPVLPITSIINRRTFVANATMSVAAFSLGLTNLASPARTTPNLRKALLIGIQDYTKPVESLANPINDARLVEAALKRANYDTNLVTNPTREDLLRVIQAHGRSLRRAGAGSIGVFYFAGHGFSLSKHGPNYLLPTGTTNLSEDALQIDAVKLDEVTKTLDILAPDADHIVAFDACRTEVSSLFRGGVKIRGFTQVSGRPGMAFLFSSSAGEPASDGKGSNGPYAKALASALLKPGLSLNDLARQVQIQVFNETGFQWPDHRIRIIRRLYPGIQKKVPNPQTSILPAVRTCE